MVAIRRGDSRRGSVRRCAFAILAVITTVAVLPATGFAAKKTNTGPRIIIDTDLSKWWDDASTIGIANVLHNQGDLRLLGIVSDVPNDAAVAALDAINTAYGNPKIPLGAMAGSDADTFDHGYTDALVDELPHSVKDSSDVPEAVVLYRKLLAKQPDHSVTIVSIGGYTNLAGLLNSKPGQGSKLDGRKLIAKKVERMVIEDGFFPSTEKAPAYTNQKIDLAAATEVLSGDGWPTPMAWVDGQPGIAARVGGALCTTVDAKHPMRIVYENLFGCAEPGDGNWDAPTLIYAIDGPTTVFTELGQGGAAAINGAGGLVWVIPSTRSGDVYVHSADQDALNARIDELLVAE
ncbi:MAG: hypothetical protein EXQ79_10500 [Acidimicrobiia bacterium]|nr:hypothetical protein [Acidimicrobiia bacterium]